MKDAKSKEEKPEKSDGKVKKSKSGNEAEAGGESSSNAQNPVSVPADPPIMVPGPVAGQLIPVQESYRQKLEMLVNHINSSLMGQTVALATSKAQAETLLREFRDRKNDIARETEYACQDMLDRLELEFKKRTAGIEHRISDIAMREDEIQKFVARVTTPCLRNTDMLKFVSSTDDLKRECELLAHRNCPSISSSSVGLSMDEVVGFPREMRETKARAEGYQKLKAILVMKDALISQLLEENTRLRKIENDLKEEVDQWIQTAQVRISKTHGGQL